LAGDAWGRKGDCQFTLTRYADAAVSYQKALETVRDASARHQALFKLGQCSEKQDKLDAAVQLYGQVIYEAIAAVASNEPPERFWSCKAARAAATVSEQQQQWREAITFYLRLAVTCPDLKPLAEDRIRKIRVERGIFFP
jgi:tetratricopeptide (TPR) repeat protein